MNCIYNFSLSVAWVVLLGVMICSKRLDFQVASHNFLTRCGNVKIYTASSYGQSVSVHILTSTIFLCIRLNNNSLQMLKHHIFSFQMISIVHSRNEWMDPICFLSYLNAPCSLQQQKTYSVVYV